MLRREGADIDAKDSKGWTPLRSVALRNLFHMAALLLGCGANPLEENNNNETPAVLASRASHNEVAQLLNDYPGKYGGMLLHLAAERGHTDRAHRLIAANVDVNAVNRDGFTSLQTAARHFRWEIVRLLLDTKRATRKPVTGYSFVPCRALEYDQRRIGR